MDCPPSSGRRDGAPTCTSAGAAALPPALAAAAPVAVTTAATQRTRNQSGGATAQLLSCLSLGGVMARGGATSRPTPATSPCAATNASPRRFSGLSPGRAWWLLALLFLAGMGSPRLGLAATTAAAAVAATWSAGASSGGGRGGSSGGSDGYSALCVVGKNENRYVREWVEYHKCLGFSRIYLYDHSSTEPMSAQLADHLASGFVSYTPFAHAAHTKFSSGYTSDLERFMATAQGAAYKDCVTRFGARHTFLGFIDLDEFVVLYDESVRNIDELLRDYERHPGLSVYWVLLGSSGHVKRPEGGVVDSYTRCTPHRHKFNTQFKTFANTRFKPTMYSPHRAVFDAPADPATGLEPYMVDEHHVRIARGRNKNCTHHRVAVYHYVTRSLEDFRAKMARGGGAGVTRPKYYFDLMDRYSKATCDGAQKTRSRFCGAPSSSTAGGTWTRAGGTIGAAAGTTRGSAPG